MSDVKEKFEDVRLDHPWVEKYRIPVVDSFYARYYYFATLALPRDEKDGIFKVEMPTEEDAILMSSYINYRISTFNFYDHYYKKIRSEKLDVDSLINTISIAKIKDKGWMYRMMTWETGPFPYYNSPMRFDTLLSLLNQIESYSKGNPNPKWEAWKSEHNIA
jgi:hypothetical protein